jgi:high-affinity nickel-transport protein
MVFGLGFDTATQISAITLSAVASATLGVQVALTLAGFFALGMIPLDTLDSILLRSALSRIFDTKGFRYMSYALSGAAMAVAALATYQNLTGAEVMPELTGPVLAGVIIAGSFGYSFASKRKAGRTDLITQEEEEKKDKTTDPHHHNHHHHL